MVPTTPVGAPPDWIWDTTARVISFSGILLLLFYFIRAMLKGDLITKREFDARMDDKNLEIANLRRDLDEYRAEVKNNQRTVQEAVHVTHQVVGALRTAAPEARVITGRVESQ